MKIKLKLAVRVPPESRKGFYPKSKRKSEVRSFCPNPKRNYVPMLRMILTQLQRKFCINPEEEVVPIQKGRFCPNSKRSSDQFKKGILNLSWWICSKQSKGQYCPDSKNPNPMDIEDCVLIPRGI